MFVDWSWSVLLSRSVSFELEFLGHSRPVPRPTLGIAWIDVQLCSSHRIHERKRGHLFCCLSVGYNNESILSFSPPFCRYPVAGTQFCPLAGYIFVVVNFMMGGKEKLVALSLRFLFLRVGGLNEMRCVGYAKAKPVPAFAGHRSALCCCFKTNSVSCWNCLFFFCCRWLCIIFEKYIERMSSLLWHISMEFRRITVFVFLVVIDWRHTQSPWVPQSAHGFRFLHFVSFRLVSFPSDWISNDTNL